MKKEHLIICLITLLAVITIKSIQPIAIPLNDGEYYTSVSYVTYTSEELKLLLDEHFSFLEYEDGVIDCSEISAYYEWFLENKGYHTFFAWSTHIIGSNHMWLLVETSEGLIPIETSCGQKAVILNKFSYSENYNMGHTCDTIYEAIKVFGISEVDWWNI
ncbi:MAG: hypothetical protein N2V78_09120 [Methanophagales archaeon]|nr:hypothetical protein [Methanophagales archaeon]